MPSWHLHPDVLLVIGALGAGYALLARRVGPKLVHPIERPVTRNQAMAFGGGLAVLFLASYWPIHDIAEGSLYPAHMTHHMLLTLTAPPLLLIGMPAWMLRYILGDRGIKVAKFLGRPLIGLIAFNAMIAISHIPSVVERTATSEPFHFGAHVLL